MSPSEPQLTEKAVAFHSGFFGSLLLCVVIHLLAPMVSAPQSILRFGLVVVFFGALASAGWSLVEPYRDYAVSRLRWQYADASPAIRRNIERIGARRARFVARIGWAITIASGLWCLAILVGWPYLPLPPGWGSVLGLLAVLAWLGVPIAAITGLRPLREAHELKRQVDEEMHASGARIRDAASRETQRKQISARPVEITAPLGFRAGGYDWRWSDFYKNAAIFGMSGSGKTICVLNAVLDGLLGSSSETGKRCAGLILDPKGDFRDKIETLCRNYGRERDLVIIDPSNLDVSIRWNPLDSQDDALEVAGRFAAVMQILSDSSEVDAFWIDSATRLVQNILSLYRLVDPDAPPSLADVYEAAMSDDVLGDLIGRVPEEVFASRRSARRTADYFIEVWRPMPDNTRGSVRSYVSNMLGSFLVEPYDEIFAGKSDVTLGEVVDKGLILYVNMPIADREVMARVVSTFIKLEYYREVLKRPNKDRPSFFLCDEFQSFFTVGQGRGDPDAFERTRQSNHANIVAFQNINALLKQTKQREPVMNLLGNCAIKLFLRNTDDDTNKYASSLFGKHIENLGGASVNVARGTRLSGDSASFSGSDQYHDRVKPEEFTTLAVPSQEDRIHHAEVIGHLAARAAVSQERQRWRVHPLKGGAET